MRRVRMAQGGEEGETLDLARLYDENATAYDEDRFELLQRSRAAVARQVRRHAQAIAAGTVVDFAVGTGESLRELSTLFPTTDLVGIDISRGMLDIACAKVPMRAIHADVREADRHLAPASADLVLVHYLLGYVDPAVVVSRAATLLRPGGYLSIATSTYECFASMQRLATAFIGADAVKDGSKVPDDAAALEAVLGAHGFEVVESERVHAHMHFRDLGELYEWGTRSSWIAQYFEKLGPTQMTDVVAQAPAHFPMNDEFHGLVVLARRVQ